jgi:putative transposase
VHENTRRLERLLAKGRARILAVTVSRKGTRLIAAFRVLIQRPVQPRVALPASRVGVDVGVRVLATVASPDGVIERVPNPRPLEAALRQLRRLCRERSRRTRGSVRYTQTNSKITRLHRRVASIRGHHLHVLTTRLAKTHGEIVAEGLDAARMLRQKGLPGARARRRGLSDSALGETRRQLGYKTGWYGSRLIVADRWYPSSKTCHACGHVQDIGWAEHWTCGGCATKHQRDDNAAINLARYEPPCAGESAVGPVRAAVKRRAGRKTGPRPAGGHEARKGISHQAGEQPRDGVPTR